VVDVLIYFSFRSVLFGLCCSIFGLPGAGASFGSIKSAADKLVFESLAKSLFGAHHSS